MPVPQQWDCNLLILGQLYDLPLCVFTLPALGSSQPAKKFYNRPV